MNTTPPPQRSFDTPNLPVVQKLSSAFKLWINHLPRIPRLLRYSLGEKITGLMIELTELLLITGYSERSQKPLLIQKASMKLDLLKYFLQTAFELKAIDAKTLAAITVPIADVGRQLGGWKKIL
ncbi:MAG: four helix bundle protein [bacterium]|nr:four helix bundle protein [bacterium]